MPTKMRQSPVKQTCPITVHTLNIKKHKKRQHSRTGSLCKSQKTKDTTAVLLMSQTLSEDRYSIVPSRLPSSRSLCSNLLCRCRLELEQNRWRAVDPKAGFSYLSIVRGQG